MRRAELVAEDFRRDLVKFLKDHNATLEVCEEDSGPFYRPGRPMMVVIIPAEYTPDGRCLAEWAEVELGTYLNGED